MIVRTIANIITFSKRFINEREQVPELEFQNLVYATDLY